MTQSNDNIDFVRRRLNSFMNEIMEGTEGSCNTQLHNVQFIGLNRFIDFHKQIKELFPENSLIPQPLSMEEITEKFQYGHGYYFKSIIREIADSLDITLEHDKKSESTPLMTQVQNVAQINLQNTNNVIECINNLQLEWDKKEEIVKLIKEFDKAAVEKNTGKLKSILKQVLEISPKAATFLFEHAAELKVIVNMLG